MIWPFNRKRRSSAMKETERQPLSEKSQPTSLPRTTKSPPPASTPPVPRRSSRRRTEREKRASQKDEKMTEAQFLEDSQRQASSEKENMPRRKGSIEDITALPVSRQLASSPHLRPADVERPHIAYNFRQHSVSQTSVHRDDAKASRPQTLRSRRSAYDSGTPQRRRSSKKRKEDQVREEEFRAMSAPIPIPKRRGDGPLRRDSKKMRGLGGFGSHVSLPPEESIHSSMSGIQEQRGWEVGSLDVFNPRPAVRLSGTPQYAAPSSVPSTSHATRDVSSRDKEKRPMTRDSARKRQTIGNQADDFDASDLRLLMERDAKRRERRKQEQQEKLDRKLRNRAGRNRGDSDKRRREAEELRKAEEANERAEQERRARDLITPPTDVHPALRDQPAIEDAELSGLGIGASEASKSSQPVEPLDDHPAAIPTTDELGTENTGTYLNYPERGNIPENPFADPAQTAEQVEPGSEQLPIVPGAFTPVEEPMEDPIIQTAQPTRLSQIQTPPLSPMRSAPGDRAPSSLSQSQASEMPEPPAYPADRRTSEPKERRAGAWASFFRRGGTTFRKPGEEGRSTPSDFSFSNTSRESMRNQPIPAHLIDTQAALRSKSSTPVRTQSKFREDLPELPISPPDSRMPSPDVTTAAAMAAAARRSHKSPVPMDTPGGRLRDSDPDPAAINRNDTPISPSARGHLMSASLASVDSEGSWLASSAKRQSTQSALSRSIGSLSKRKPEFVGSYEELGGDKDAEYVNRKTPSPGLGGQRISTPAHAGASPDEESEYGDSTPANITRDPLTVHDSVRRKPTLVHRDPRVKSREGLLSEYSAAAESAETEDSPATKDEFDLEDTSEMQVQSARSVDYGKSHARQVSAGSARLLDIKRPSIDSPAGFSAGSRPSSFQKMN